MPLATRNKLNRAAADLAAIKTKREQLVAQTRQGVNGAVQQLSALLKLTQQDSDFTADDTAEIVAELQSMADNISTISTELQATVASTIPE